MLIAKYMTSAEEVRIARLPIDLREVITTEHAATMNGTDWGLEDLGMHIVRPEWSLDMDAVTARFQRIFGKDKTLLEVAVART